jgi:hypothetical protein
LFVVEFTAFFLAILFYTAFVLSQMAALVYATPGKIPHHMPTSHAENKHITWNIG